MGVETILVRGPHDADYFQNEMFPDKIAGTGHFVAVAEDSGVQFVNWTSRMPLAYNVTQSIDVVIDWVSVNVTSGAVVWQAEVERLGVGLNPLNASNFDTPQSDPETVSGTLSAVTRTRITMTNSQFDSIEPGEDFRLRLTRNTASGSDTLIGDALMLNWSLESNI